MRDANQRGRIKRRWGIALGFLLCASARLAAAAELQVLGQPILQAQLSSTSDGSSIVSGRLLDETGSPLSGELRALSSAGLPLRFWSCADDADSGPRAAQTEVFRLAEDGEFCLRISGIHNHITASASAPSFLRVEQLLQNDGSPRLPRPAFSQAPQVLDLHEAAPSIVLVLTDGPDSHIAGAEVTLSLDCQGQTTLLGDPQALSGSKLIRFEFAPPRDARPGTCQFEARVSAPGHDTQIERKSVLAVAEVKLTVISIEESADEARVIVQVTTQAGEPVLEGIAEGTHGGAHLVSAPVEAGKAKLEFEKGVADRNVVLSYLPAGPAYRPGSSLELYIQKRDVGFRWITAHSLGLVSFCAWLVYAWLKPRQRSRGGGTPPGKPLVTQGTRARGPITGVVLDAHTGEPVSGARVCLVEASALQLIEKEATMTEQTGHFVFQVHAERGAHLRLVVDAPDYMSLEASASGAELTIHLSERRREVVRQLLAWSTRAGRPWMQKPRPTPLEIQEAAARLGKEREERWARRVSELAYRKAPPSEAEVKTAETPETLEKTHPGAIR